LAPGRLKSPKPSQPVLVPGEDNGPGAVASSAVPGALVVGAVVVGNVGNVVDVGDVSDVVVAGNVVVVDDMDDEVVVDEGGSVDVGFVREADKPVRLLTFSRDARTAFSFTQCRASRV
jgi:hypothetical protein